MTGAESPTMTRREDADPALVRAAQRGDPMALGELMEVLAPYVGRICGPIALQDGPDAAQEALITILRGIGGAGGAPAPVGRGRRGGGAPACSVPGAVSVRRGSHD